MSNSKQGFILRKPQGAKSNDPFSSEADTLVIPGRKSEGVESDGDRYRAAFLEGNPPLEPWEYLVIPVTTQGGSLVSDDPEKLLAVRYTRNDEIRRFGYNDRTQRWEPYKGTAPRDLGLIQNPLTLEEVSPETGKPEIAVGSPENFPRIQVEWLFGEVDWDLEVIPPMEARASVETGEIYFGSDLLTASAGKKVYQFFKHFLKPSKENTGIVGRTGGGDIFLNPIPKEEEFPRVRIGFNSYLKNPIWDFDTGKLENDLSSYGGDLPVYYDGVYNVKEPIKAFPPLEVGDINPHPKKTELEFLPGDLDLEALTLYVKEEGVSIEEIKWVSSFSKSLALPESVAEVSKTDTGTVKVRLSFKFASQYAGKTVMAANAGDFYLEHGITFRLDRPLIDLSSKKGVAAAKVIQSFRDEVIVDSISPGAFTPLPQVPLQDVGGYDVNTFYKIEQGARQKVLKPDEDVVYDFENNFLRWASRKENQVLAIDEPTSVLKLRDELLLDRNYTFELDQGSGYSLLEEGKDVITDFEGGQIAFTKKKGGVLYEGIGNLSGDLLESYEDMDFQFEEDPSLITETEKMSLLIVEETGEVFYIRERLSSRTLRLEGQFNDQKGVRFQILEGTGEVVYSLGYHEAVLSPRWVFPEIILPVEEDNLYVPMGWGNFYHFETSTGQEVSHKELSPINLGPMTEGHLEIPSSYRGSHNRYKILRAEKELQISNGPNPGRNEFYVAGDFSLHFNPEDIATYGTSTEITLVPEHSQDPLEIEVLTLQGRNSFRVPSQTEIRDLRLVLLVKEDKYTFQKESGTLYFKSPLPKGSRVRVRYYEDDSFREITEDISFPVREEADVRPHIDNKISFGGGLEVDIQKPVTLLVNGKKEPSRVNTGTKVITFNPLQGPRKVQITYYVREAYTGQEKIVRLSQIPFAPDPVFEEGSTSQTFYGDHRELLGEGKVLFCEADESFVYEVLGTPTYDPVQDKTHIELSRPAQKSSPSRVLVSNRRIEQREVVVGPGISVRVDPYNEGEHEIRILGGDLTKVIRPLHLLYVGSTEIHIVSQSFYDSQKDMTTILLASTLGGGGGTTGPSLLQVSKHPIYPPHVAVLRTRDTAFTGEKYQSILIRFPGEGSHLRGQGEVYDPKYYTFSDDGTIVIDPSNPEAPLPEAGDRWVMSYLSRREVGPVRKGYVAIIPRLRASYTKYIAATTENGLAGSALKARYSVYSPDTYYFRALSLEDFATEVALQLGKDVAGPSGPSGPITSFSSSQKNHEMGVHSLVWQEGDLRDRDRVGRYYIRHFNGIIALLEQYSQSLTGLLIGDRDGPFKFDIKGDGQPGGEEPYTGDLIPYYPNPFDPGIKPSSGEIRRMRLREQRPHIINDIDDMVLVSKRPYKRFFGFGFSFEGTFKKVWEPSSLSRFFPEESVIATATPPTMREGGDDQDPYTFLDDYGEFLGDLGHEDVLSVKDLRRRGSRARIKSLDIKISAGKVTIKAGMTYNPFTGEVENEQGEKDLLVGDPDSLIPGFEEGDKVHLGRKNLETGATFLYGEYLEVEEVKWDEITLKFDPADVPDFGQMRVLDTIFEQSSLYYREGIDFSVNNTTGELINKTLPPIVSPLLEQDAPEPNTYLEATTSYRNKRVEPLRPPALDGELYDDDGLLGAPYWGPLEETERRKIREERKGWDVLYNNTVPGYVGTATFGTTGKPSFLFGENLPPDVNAYDLVVIEGRTETPESWSKGSTPYYAAKVENGNELFLTAFEVLETGISYVLRIPMESSGQIDPNDSTRWLDDSGFDFTSVSFGNGTLRLGASSYVITGKGPGYLEVNGPISNYAGTYEIEITGGGGIPNLYTFEDDSEMFTGIPVILDGFPVTEGTSFEILAGNIYNGAGPYGVASLEGNLIYIMPQNFTYGDVGTSYEVAISPSLPVSLTLSGAVIGADLQKIWVYPDPTQIVKEGYVITIRSGSNAGYYRVTEVSGEPESPGIPGSPDLHYVKVHKPLRQPEGQNQAMTLYVNNPRRFSKEIESLEEVLSEYKDFLGNSQTLLEQLQEEILGPPVLEASDGELTYDGASYKLSSSSVDFGAAGLNNEDSYIILNELGYYKVGPSPVQGSEIEIDNGGLIKFEGGQVPEPQEGHNLKFRAYRTSTYEHRTYEFVWYEYFNIIGIKARIEQALEGINHDPLALKSDSPLSTFPGDLNDECIDLHRDGSFTSLPIGLRTREEWISPQEEDMSALDEIETILKSSESLYDQRFTWIDYRINREYGTLPRRKRFEADRRKARAKQIRDLMKMANLGE